jgi:primosomal protein N' (replication factor Y) (superfamily II helicase)
MQPPSGIIEVAVPLHLEQTFTYALPAALPNPAVTGLRVLVPFGKRTITGYILGFVPHADGLKVKEVLEVLDSEPLFTASDLEFYRWIASYYMHPLGEVIKTALPPGLTIMGRRKAGVADDGSPVYEELLSRGTRCREERHFIASAEEAPQALKGRALELFSFILSSREASASSIRSRFGGSGPQLKRLKDLGLIREEKREVYRDPFSDQPVRSDIPLDLNTSQKTAMEALEQGIDAKEFRPFLLHGVTGSGKTEVYLQAISYALDKGKDALVLVPEIGLTPQLVERFRRRFSCGIAVLHSGLSSGERYDEWRRIRRGEARIVIGARSAIFAPVGNLGILVVDEEHETTYKQSDGLRYNARDLSLVLGKQCGAVVLLGSATPLVTTFHAARTGRIAELSLGCRVNDRPMPDTLLIDQRGRKGATLSPELIEALRGNLAMGGQTILLLNRRGFATWLECRDCGHTLRCPNCSVTLTYHQNRKRHICHYCDHSIPAPSLCPECRGGEIGLFGQGTERLEEEVSALFPEARIARMDRDTTSGRGGYSRILKKFENGETDILIGTQMIAKGHDFPGVTLVGVVSADTALNLPDFRGAERGFQLVSQVMGRAGRGDQPGKVLVQTLNPEHFALITAAAHDYETFYKEELAERKDAGYPPFSHLAALHFSGNSLPMVEKEAKAVADHLREMRQKLGWHLEILGPASAPLGMIRGRYRWQILLKSARRAELHRLLQQFRGEHVPRSTVRMAIDIDPLELL